jgi:N-acyl-D-amino-acid deacylase
LLLNDASGKPHPKLSQGVTTVITGNCGVSLAPLQSRDVPAPLDILGSDAYHFASFAEYLEALQASRPACNAASLVGHTTLRVKHVMDLSREATDSECQAMAKDVQAALSAGALGLSTGVYYPPARAASMKEMIAVAKPLGAAQALITMHLRNEADAIDDALREAFAVSKAVGCALVLSHHKLIGSNNHGRSVQTLALIDQTAMLQSICLDCYPYDASSTMLLPERVASSRDVRITWSRAQPEAAGEAKPATPESPVTPASPATAAQQRIEVTGGRADDTTQRQRSTAAKIVIGREEIDKFGDATLGEVLRRLPGVTTPGAPGRGG